MHKKVTQNGESQRYSWGTQKKTILHMMSCMLTKTGPKFARSFERAEDWPSSSHARIKLPTHLQGWVTPVLANKASLALTPEFVGWLLNVPATCQCISGTDLHRQFYVLPHWDRSCRPNFSSHPVTVYWHRADQSQRWPYARRLAG